MFQSREKRERSESEKVNVGIAKSLEKGQHFVSHAASVQVSANKTFISFYLSAAIIDLNNNLPTRTRK